MVDLRNFISQIKKSKDLKTVKTKVSTKFEIAGIDPVIILIPVAIGLVGYMLKKQGILKIRNQPVEVKTA